MGATEGGGFPAFSTIGSLDRRWSATRRRMALSAGTPAELRLWRRRLIRKLKALSGYDTLRPTALRPRITDQWDEGAYLRQRVEIQVERGLAMPLFVLLPREHGRGPFPAVIAAHGHCAGGKIAVAGVRVNDQIERLIEEYNYDYGVQMVRAGFAVFCPDARGFGERRERWQLQAGDLVGSSCREVLHAALGLGRTVTGLWTWDLHRLLDYIQTRSDCRPDAIACIGLSGGGLQTLWATALDEGQRIRAAILSGYFYGYRQSLLQQAGNCSCNYVPHLWEHVDMGDIAALIAPRPLLIETGDQDGLNGADGLRNVAGQIRIARRAYRLLGVERRLQHHIFHGGHRWDGTRAVQFLRAALGCS